MAVIEAEAWRKSVEERILRVFGPDTLARYELTWQLYNDELRRHEGDEITRSLNAKRRIVNILSELQERGNTGTSFAKPVGDHEAQALKGDRDPQSYDLFISHASEDKESIARPLYEGLVSAGVSVWFDEATLELGDSLRRKIDAGLARCRFGIVILSPKFLSKEWPQRELDGLLARETATGEKALLPLWHELDGKTLARHSPVLADRLAVRSEEGIGVVIEKILRVLKR